ncbi:MAG: hypothetical protein CSA66_02355 [Proteobacteria bacterium]|nr:MAG: hypothetical protein CSA66_02355 [Pseudomonadota bacterium]
MAGSKGHERIAERAAAERSERAAHRKRLPTIPPPLPSDAAGAPRVTRRRERPVAASHPSPWGAFAGVAARLVTRFDAARAVERHAERGARLAYEAARLLEHPLGRLEEAVERYGLALATLEDHLPSIRGARRCLLRLGRVEAALAHLDRELGLTAEAAPRAALLRLRARLLEDRLADLEGARASWAEAVAQTPDDAGSLAALAHNLRATGAWEELAEVLGRAATVHAADLTHRAALLVQRARVVERRLGQPTRAIDIYGQALSLDPSAPGALDALERLLTADRRWGELIDVLELELAQVDDVAAKTVTLQHMADIAEAHLEDVPGALGYLERALAMSPQDAAILGDLERLYHDEGRWEALRDVLERRANTLADRARRVDAWYRLGEICEARLGDPDAAARWYQAALSLDAGHAPSLRALERHYGERGEWFKLVEVVQREGDCALAPERRAAAFARAGELGEQHLHDRDFAIAQHEHALTLVPDHPASFVALSRLYAEAGQRRRLVELLERAAARARSDEAAVHHLWRVARLYEDALDEPEHAVAVYRRILERAPGRVDAMRALQRAAERAGRYRDLLAGLELELQAAAAAARPVASPEIDPERQVQIALHAARLLADHLGEPQRAAARLEAVLRVRPAEWGALRELERLYRQLGRSAALREVLETGLELEPAGEPALDRLLALGALCEGPLAELEEAASYYERALGQSPDDVPAQRALARVLARLQRWERYVEVGLLALERKRDPTERACCACALGAIAELRLGDPQQASTIYQRALAARPDWPPASAALARLADLTGDANAALEALEGVRRAVGDQTLQRRALVAQGQLLADVVGDPRAAARRFEVLRSLCPTDPTPLLELSLLYRQLGRWEDLADLYRALSERLAPAPAQLGSLRELARLEAQHGIGEPASTARRMARVAGDDREALLWLEEQALDAGDWELLRQVDGRVVLVDAGPASLTADHRLRLAEGLEATGHPDALRGYLEAVEADPSSLGAAHGLVRVAEADEDTEALAVGLLHLSDLTADDVEAARLLVRMADLHADRDDTAGALEALDMALGRNPDDGVAALRVAALVERREDVEPAIGLLSRAARAARDPERVRDLWTQIALWRADNLDDRGDAIAALEAALEAAPTHGASLSRLADLYLLDAQHTRAADRLEQIVGAERDTARALAARIKLAEIYTTSLDDHARAEALTAELAASDPDPVTAEHLIALQRRLGLTQQALATCQLLVASAARSGSSSSATSPRPSATARRRRRPTSRLSPSSGPRGARPSPIRPSSRRTAAGAPCAARSKASWLARRTRRGSGQAGRPSSPSTATTWGASPRPCAPSRSRARVAPRTWGCGRWRCRSSPPRAAATMRWPRRGPWSPRT